MNSITLSLQTCLLLIIDPVNQGFIYIIIHKEAVRESKDLIVDKSTNKILTGRISGSADQTFPNDYNGGYGEGVHLFPFRTEKLRPSALMVLP